MTDVPGPDPLIIRSLEFLGGMAGADGWRPEPTLPEIAFAGRSNVGKSSLLNRLVRRKAFARVSRTPGRTREINFFKVNSQFVLDQSARFAQRLQSEAGDDRTRQVNLAWQLGFSRKPTGNELEDALGFLSRQVEHLKAIPEKKDENSKKDDKTKPVTKPVPELQALTDLCQALLSANEFLYVD